MGNDEERPLSDLLDVLNNHRTKSLKEALEQLLTQEFEPDEDEVRRRDWPVSYGYEQGHEDGVETVKKALRKLLEAGDYA